MSRKEIFTKLTCNIFVTFLKHHRRKIFMAFFHAYVIDSSCDAVLWIFSRELDLRGYKFNQIENLGATLDQFDRKCFDIFQNAQFYRGRRFIFTRRVLILAPDMSKNKVPTSVLFKMVVKALQSMMMNDNDVKKIENFPYLPRIVHDTFWFINLKLLLYRITYTQPQWKGGRKKNVKLNL